MQRRFIALRSLLIIAVMEWKRFVISGRFILIGILPPLILLSYPTTYELVSNTILNLNSDSVVSALSPRPNDLKFEENRIDSDKHYIQYAVLDQSSGIHQRIRTKILQSDLKLFLEALIRMSESDFTTWAQKVIIELNEKYPSIDSATFLRNLIEFHSTLSEENISGQVLTFAEQIQNTNNIQPTHFLSAPIATLWINVPEQIIAVVPLISLGLFREIDSKDHTFESLQTLLLSGEIQGVFVIPNNVSEKMVDLKLFTRTETSSSSIEALKLFYQPLITDIVRTQQLGEISSANEDELPTLTIHWSEISTIGLDIDRTWSRHNWWGSPNKVFAFIADQHIIIVSFVTLVILIFCAPLMTINTIEERSSKLAEMLLASVDAKFLLDSKVFGILMGVLTAVGFWVVLQYGCLVLFPKTIPAVVLLDFQAVHFLHWMFFLFTAIVFYGYLVTALGSICNNQIDVVMIIFPVFLLYALAAMCIYDMIENQSSVVATILSFFPPLTPFIMVGRTDMLPEWPIYLVIVLVMLGSIFLVRAISGSFFSHALLVEERPRNIRGFVRLVQRPD